LEAADNLNFQFDSINRLIFSSFLKVMEKGRERERDPCSAGFAYPAGTFGVSDRAMLSSDAFDRKFSARLSSLIMCRVS